MIGMKKMINEEAKKVINQYQYCNVSFLEAVQAIINKAMFDKITREEAETAIKQISRIKLPH